MNQDPRQGPCAAPIGWPRLSEGNLLDLRGPPLAGPSDARSGCPRRRSPSSSTARLPSNRRPRRRQRLVAKERRMPVRSPHPDVDIPARRPRDVPLRQGSRRARGRARVRRRDHRRVAHVSRSCTSRSSGSRRRSRSGGSGAATSSRCTRRTPRPGRPSSTACCARTRRSPASTCSTPPASWPPSSRTPGPGWSSPPRPCWSGPRPRRRRPGSTTTPWSSWTAADGHAVHRRPARLHRRATRTGGRARRPRRAALLLGHLRPAQGRDPHPPQPRGEPAADARRSRQVGPGDRVRRRAAVLPHLRHDRAAEPGDRPAARPSSPCPGSTWPSSFG